MPPDVRMEALKRAKVCSLLHVCFLLVHSLRTGCVCERVCVCVCMSECVLVCVSLCRAA